MSVSVCVCGHESHGWTEKGLGDPCSRDILTDLAWRHNVDHWTASSVVVVEVTVGGNGGQAELFVIKAEHDFDVCTQTHRYLQSF